MTDDMHVVERPYTTPESFLDALSLCGAHFSDDPINRQWIFRGQAEASWPLQPTLLRQFDRMAPPTTPLDPASVRYFPFIRHEAQLLRRFADLANRNGLVVPNCSEQLMYQLDTCIDPELWGSAAIADTRKFPHATHLPLIALARHHNVPTRLLDWTFNPMVAAYFAARGSALKRQRSHGQHAVSGTMSMGDAMGVWGLSPVQHIQRSGIGRDGIDVNCPSRSFYEFCTVSTAPNRNLQAQQGVFLVCRHAAQSEAPIFERLRNVVERDGSVSLTQITLPHRQSGKLLRLLALHGIDAATLFPGYDGVTEAMNEQELWEQ